MAMEKAERAETGSKDRDRMWSQMYLGSRTPIITGKWYFYLT